MSPRGERLMVPDPFETPRPSAPQEPPQFESYYGRQIIKTPTWKTPDVPLYLFLGGLAGASAVLAEGAAATGRPALERVARIALPQVIAGALVQPGLADHPVDIRLGAVAVR